MRLAFAKRAFVKRLVTGLLIALLMMAAFIAGSIRGTQAQLARAQDEAPLEFAIFWEVWDLVGEFFVDQDRIDYKAMTYGAIQGMLDSLGDENHTVFFAPDVARQQESALEGSFEGIGAYVSSEEGKFVIVSPIHGSPAEAAGILAGDTVLAVDGADITGMEEWEVIGLIRGPAGSSVVLTILHAEATDPVEIAIRRGKIDIESVLWARIPGTDLVHLQITQFAGDTSRELRSTLRSLQLEAEQGRPVTGILLDLRNNPGGYLQEAVRVAGQFLPEDAIVLHEQDAQDHLTTYRAQGEGLAREFPLVVLINQGSASAAEIVAGALQENGRAQLVGTTTVGTGTVLRPFTLSDGSVLRLGVTNWLTPKRNLIKGQGVQPDTLVEQEASVEMISQLLLEELSDSEVRLHEDEQFQAGLRILNAASNGEHQAATPQQANP
jgi:carboxyl-terminal processing protease